MITPEQEREIRARMGSEVQSQAEGVVVGSKRLTSEQLNVKYLASIVAAAHFLRAGAPGIALERLDEAMRL